MTRVRLDDTPAPQSEGALKLAVCKALTLLPNVRVLRMNAGSTSHTMRGAAPGTPDLLVMLPHGRTLWIELKTQRGELSEGQRAWHSGARLLGHTVHVVRDVQSALTLVRTASASPGSDILEALVKAVLP